MSRVLSAILIVVVVIGCDSVEERPLECLQQPVPGTLRPLEVGNRWDYEFVSGDGSISYTFRETVTEQLDSLSVYGTPLYVISKVRSTSPTKVTRGVWASSSHGHNLFGYLNEEDSLQVRTRTFPFPTEVGTAFVSTSFRADSTTGELYAYRSWNWEVAATNNSVSIPFGNFSTVVYEQKWYALDDMGTGPFFYQFAPGIGKITWDAHRFASTDGEDAAWHYRLVDYCLMQ